MAHTLEWGRDFFNIYYFLGAIGFKEDSKFLVEMMKCMKGLKTFLGDLVRGCKEKGVAKSWWWHAH